MVWTAPRTWVVGEKITDSQLNQHLRDNLLHVGDPTSRPMFRFHKSAAQGYTSGAGLVAVVFDTSIYDIGSCRASTSTVAIPRAGWWMFDAWVRTTQTTMNVVTSLNIYNGTEYVTASHFYPNAGSAVYCAARTTIKCTVGMVVTVHFFSNSASTIEASSSGWAGHWIRD